jgi:hypothetical protein
MMLENMTKADSSKKTSYHFEPPKARFRLGIPPATTKAQDAAGVKSPRRPSFALIPD